METTPAAFFRRRMLLSARFNKWAVIIAGALGLGISAISPENVDSSTRIGWGLTGALGAIVGVSLLVFVWRFIWIAPQAMYFDLVRQQATMARVNQIEIEYLQEELNSLHARVTPSP
jgi:hypothetical protein